MRTLKLHLVSVSLIIVAIGLLIANHYAWSYYVMTTTTSNPMIDSMNIVLFPIFTIFILLVIILIYRIYISLTKQVDKICKIKEPG